MCSAAPVFARRHDRGATDSGRRTASSAAHWGHRRTGLHRRHRRRARTRAAHRNWHRLRRSAIPRMAHEYIDVRAAFAFAVSTPAVSALERVRLHQRMDQRCVRFFIGLRVAFVRMRSAAVRMAGMVGCRVHPEMGMAVVVDFARMRLNTVHHRPPSAHAEPRAAPRQR